MTRRLAAGAGGVALIASLFLPWYRAGGWFAYEGQPRVFPTFSAWEAFVALDVVLVACAVAAIAGSARVAGPLAWIAVLVVATRLTIPGHDLGVWVALAASLPLLARAEVPPWRPRRADALALAGGALLFGSLFAGWYGIGTPRGLDSSMTESLSAWAAFELTPVAMTVAAVFAIGHRSKAAAAVAVGLVAYALLSIPDIAYGAWLGLAGAVLLLAGTWRAASIG